MSDMFSKEIIIKEQGPDEEPYIFDGEYNPWYKKYYYRLKWFIQKYISKCRYFIRKIRRCFTKNGFIPEDIYSLNYKIYDYLLPRLKAFREQENLTIPGFCFRKNYADTESALKYWKYLLDMAIYALEYYSYGKDICPSDEIVQKFWIKYFNESPFEEKPENESHLYEYYILNPPNGLSHWASNCERLTSEQEKEQGCELRRIYILYHNHALLEKAAKKADKGMVILGRIIPHLWGVSETDFEDID